MPEVYLQLVNLYVKEQRTPDAITELESYLKAFPNSQFS
jgi:outer membrane protein assembly factor BamD (BamD/ComL family)